jgi:hypothetical protein
MPDAPAAAYHGGSMASILRFPVCPLSCPAGDDLIELRWEARRWSSQARSSPLNRPRFHQGSIGALGQFVCLLRND